MTVEEMHNMEEDHEFAAEVGNSISPEDRPYLLMRVLQQMLNDTPVIELAAWNEAIVYELYDQLKNSVTYEIETASDEGTKRETLFIRKLIFDALKESAKNSGGDEDLDIPKLRSKNIQAWEEAVEMLTHDMFWDIDLLAYNSFADMDPQQAENMKKILGIDQDYFSDSPSSVTKEERESFPAELKKLFDEEESWRQQFIKTGQIT